MSRQRLLYVITSTPYHVVIKPAQKTFGPMFDKDRVEIIGKDAEPIHGHIQMLLSMGAPKRIVQDYLWSIYEPIVSARFGGFNNVY